MKSLVERCATTSSVVKYVPAIGDPDHEESRCLLLHKNVFKLVDLATGTFEQRTKVELNMQLNSYVRGRLLTIQPAPATDKSNCEIKGLKHLRGIMWSMRFRRKWNYRLLGVVPERDIFLGLVLCPRADLDWHQAGKEALELYDEIRGDYRGDTVSASDVAAGFSNWRTPS